MVLSNEFVIETHKLQHLETGTSDHRNWILNWTFFKNGVYVTETSILDLFSIELSSQNLPRSTIWVFFWWIFHFNYCTSHFTLHIAHVWQWWWELGTEEISEAHSHFRWVDLLCSPWSECGFFGSPTPLENKSEPLLVTWSKITQFANALHISERCDTLMIKLYLPNLAGRKEGPSSWLRI